MNVETLHDLFLFELRGLYYVETELVGELEQLADQTAVESLDDDDDAAIRDALRDAFADHRRETEDHVRRLETTFDAIDRRPDRRTVRSLDGLVEEKERFTNVVLNDAIRLLYFLDVGRRIERLEVGFYERLLTNADALEVPEDAVEALSSNLDSERDALATLEELADGSDVQSLRDALGDESPEL